MNVIDLVKQLRSNYSEIKKQLPWLDSCVHEEDKPAFPNYIPKQNIPSVKAVTLKPEMKGQLGTLKEVEKIRILRYDPQVSDKLASIKEIIPEMIKTRQIFSIFHTDVEFTEIANFADQNPDLIIMIESGPRKTLYHIDKIKETLKNGPNIYHSTYNFCNWLGIEEICEMGLSHKLLFGTHSPQFSPDVALGPIIMAKIPWETKCDIAGNNLRKLLGEEIVECKEIEYQPVTPFIIDAHAHNLEPGNTEANTFATPDLNFTPKDWTDFMDYCALEKLFLTPMESLFASEKSSIDFSADLRKHDPDRFFYFEMFNPTGDEKHVELMKKSLSNPNCIGIKIHPSTHKVEADHDTFEEVWKIATEYKKTIMTHSWDISDYNPVQYMSHPDRFRKYLKKYPEVKFVLGHAGGRPGAFNNVVKVCRDYPNVSVDISGDYFDSGMIDAMANGIGADKILFGTDMDWMDPRCQLGAVLGSNLTDEDVGKILRENAIEIYLQ